MALEQYNYNVHVRTRNHNSNFNYKAISIHIVTHVKFLNHGKLMVMESYKFMIQNIHVHVVLRVHVSH